MCVYVVFLWVFACHIALQSNAIFVLPSRCTPHAQEAAAAASAAASASVAVAVASLFIYATCQPQPVGTLPHVLRQACGRCRINITYTSHIAARFAKKLN